MADEILTLRTEAEAGDLQAITKATEELHQLSAEVIKASDDLERLSRESTETGGDLGKLEDAVNRVGDKLRDANGRFVSASDGVDKLGDEAQDSSGKLAKLRKELNVKAAKAFGGAINAAKESLVGFQRRLGEMAVEKVVEAFKNGAAAVAEFDESMAQVRGLTGATGKAFEQLGDAAQELGKTTRFTAGEAAQLQAEFARAGFSIEEILDSSAGALRLAQVGMMSLSEAAGAAATQVRAFGGEAEQTNQFVDQLALQANNAKTTVADLAVATGKAAPSMVAMNGAMGEAGKSATELQKEALALAGTLANSGIEGEEAGVALSNLGIQLTQLQKPGSDLAEKLRLLGVTADDLDPRVVGLMQAVENLADAQRRGGESFDLVGSKAGRALAVLVQNTEATRENMAALDNAAGFAERLAKIYDDNLVGAYKSAVSAAQNLALVIGETGAADAASSSLKILTDGMRDNEEAAQALGVVFGTVGAAVNAIANALVTGFTVAIDAVTAAVQKLGIEIGEGMQHAATAMGLFSEDMAEEWRAAGEEMERISREKFDKAIDNLGDAAEKGRDRFGDIGEDFAGIFGFVGDEAEGMSGKASKAFEALGESQETIAGLSEGLRESAEATTAQGDEADATAEKLFELSLAALDVSRSVNEGLENLGGKELELFRQKSAETVQAAIDSFIEFGAEVPEQLVDDLARVSDAFDGLPEKVGASLEAVREKAVELSAGIRAALGDGFETPEQLDQFSEGVRDDVEKILDDFERLGVEAPEHFQEVADAVGALPERLRAVRAETDAIVESITSVPEKIADQAQAIGDAFEQMGEKTPLVREKFGAMTDELVAKAKEAGVEVPAEVKAIRDELGLTAQAAQEAADLIADAMGGLTEAIDWEAGDRGAQIRAFFTDMIMGSEEVRAAFGDLDAGTRSSILDMIDNLESLAAGGSLTEDKLEAAAEKIEGMLTTAGSTGSLEKFNAALSSVSGSGAAAGAGVDQATAAGERAGVTWDKTSQTMKTAEEATTAAAESAKAGAVAWDEATGTMRSVEEAAGGVKDAAEGAGEGFEKAGENAAGAVDALGEFAEAGQQAGEAQGQLGEQAGEAMAQVKELVDLVQQLTGVDLGPLVGQLKEGDQVLKDITGSAASARTEIEAAAAAAWDLSEGLAAADGAGGGEGGEA